MSSYVFVSVWRVSAPLEAVWHEIFQSENWPQWWRGVLSVVELKKGGENRVGGISRYTWRSKIPYLIVFDVEATRVEPMTILEGVAKGDLNGKGTWHFSQEGSETVVRYEWDVVTTKWWMNLLSPIARPLFKWNHDVIMNWGAEGLAKRIGAKKVMTANA